jgi:hypothetical protein
VSDSGPSCPIPNAHRRQHEAHRLWHRALDTYDDPDEFRTNLNALIQALRNITFILQKEHRGVPDFEAWYAGWQDVLRADGVLRWLVAARNMVVKEGDLETLSAATAGIQASWDEPEIVKFEVPPMVPTVAIAAMLAGRDVPDDVRKGGLMRVERRWVVQDLPDWELLDALAHCYGILSLLVKSAHTQAGVPMHTYDMRGSEPRVLSTELAGGRLPCMVAAEDARSVVVNLRTEEILQGRAVQPQLGSREEAEKRYGPPLRPPPESNDPLDWAPFFMERAKQVLARDKWHAEFAFLFHPDGHRFTMTTMPRDQQEKYIFMNDVANEIRRFGFTGLVLTADAWWTPLDEAEPGKRPGEMKGRSEALTVTAARSDGATRLLTTPYQRKLRRIKFEKTEEVDDAGQLFLAPVLRAWGLPAPSEREEIERFGLARDAGPKDT